MNNPKVSIIIPVYNGSNYMREAIDSALAQTYENCEIIVVNDGSTDNTEEIALSYGDKIRYFSKENGGVSSALNVGIEHMTGEYFQFLPHDDMIHPQKIEKNIRAIIESGNPMSIVWSGWNQNFSDINQKIKYEFPFRYNNKEQVTNGIIPLLFNILISVTVVLHKDYFKKVGKFELDLFTSQDYDMWYKTFSNQKTIYLDEELVDYRFHSAQGTQADPEFDKNCEELSKRMVDKLTLAEKEVLFGSEYMFNYVMLDFYMNVKWEERIRTLLKQFREIEEPLDVVEKNKMLEFELRNMGKSREVYLYCAGKNGQRFIRELKRHKISVTGISDSNRDKCKGYVYDVPCIEKEMIPKDSLIIVTNDQPEDVIKNLKMEGYVCVDSYKNLANKVFNVIPYKEEVIREVEVYLETNF